MEFFQVNTEFVDWKSVLEVKKQYEESSKTLLVKSDCHKFKGDGILVETFVYDRIILTCKAGPERPNESNGYRESSTYKKNCPVKVRLAYSNNKLIVKESNLNHENHATDQQTYDHYPENVRLNPNQKVVAEQLIEMGANKKKVKMHLMKESGKPVLLKSLHNIQTKTQSVRQSGPDTELQKLYDILSIIPGAKVRFISNDEEELVGIFFQDARMMHLYDKYPELVLYDATYKLTNRQLALFIQLIASLYICRSESREGIGAMIDCFKEFNPSWPKTEVFVGDKDFADRSIYQEKFPNASLQICLFHVAVIFNREITTTKRQITTQQREQVLEILRKLLYSKSEKEYDETYNQLLDTKLEHVIKYYNENWNPIKDEWVSFARNRHANYMNETNNRSERLNRTFKQIGNRYANLLTFFENISTSVAVIASEKDIKAIRGTMKTTRQRFHDPVLQQYNALLTPFIFKKIKEQLELCDKVHIEFQHSNNLFVSQSGYIVDEDSCTCMFFSAMKLPCRHIFRLLQLNEYDLFVPNLCSERWKKTFYNQSHPALSAYEVVKAPEPISVRQIHAPDEINKYKKAAKFNKEMNNLVANMSTGQYNHYLEKLQNLRNEMADSIGEDDGTPGPSTAGPLRHNENMNPNPLPITSGAVPVPRNPAPALQMSNQTMNAQNNDANLIRVVNSSSSLATAGPSCSANIDPYPSPILATSSPIPNATVSIAPNITPASSSSLNTVVQMSNRSIDTYNNQANSAPNVVVPSPANPTTSSIPIPLLNEHESKGNIGWLKLPKKIVSIGRPKRSGQTVIGLKKKMKTSNSQPNASGPTVGLKRKIGVTNSQPNVATSGSKRRIETSNSQSSNVGKSKFLDLNPNDQSMKIVMWLTNMRSDEITRKKVTYSDIIQDSNIFNRLRNDAIDITGIKKLVDSKCYKYLVTEIKELEGCTKCKKNLTGEQIMCNSCLDWYHISCAGLTKANSSFFCEDC